MAATDERALDLVIHGTVQGVCFRDATRRRACALGVRGYVRNEPEGTVFVHAEGDSEAIEGLVEWCRQGPPLARVVRVERRSSQVEGADGFRVTF